MAKVNDIRTFKKGQKETDALVASATDDISQILSQKQSKERLENMHNFMEPK